MVNILFVDDEQIYQAGFLRLMSRRKDVYIRCSGDGEDALSILNSYAADIVITDVTMPKMNGIDLLKLIKIRHPRTFVVVITGFGTVGQAVEAMTLGACDYLMKPLTRMGCGVLWTGSSLTGIFLLKALHLNPADGKPVVSRTSSARTRPCIRF